MEIDSMIAQRKNFPFVTLSLKNYRSKISKKYVLRNYDGKVKSNKNMIAFLIIFSVLNTLSGTLKKMFDIHIKKS